MHIAQNGSAATATEPTAKEGDFSPSLLTERALHYADNIVGQL
jgi:hypothetical protein